MRKFLYQVAACCLLTIATGFSSAVEVGEVAPDFTLADIHSGDLDFTLSKLRGQVVYLDLWASWCAPCLRSLPLYNELHSRYQNQGVAVIGVNVDDPTEDGLEFLLDTPLDFKIPADPEGNVPELYGVRAMPTSFLIDRNGVIRMIHEGFRDGDLENIENHIRQLLEE